MMSLLIWSLCLVIPLVILQVQKRLAIIQNLGPAIICYLIGFLASFLINHESIQQISEISLILSLPLLLMNSKLSRLIQVSPSVLLSFLLSIITVTVSVLVIFYFSSADKILPAATVALFTGGTVNLSSLYVALGFAEHVYLSIMSYDFLIGAFYLFIAMKLAKAYGQREQLENETLGISEKLFQKKALPFLALMLMINALCLASSYLFFAKIHATYLIASLTLVSLISASFHRFEKTEIADQWGEYFILVFCLSIAMQVNLQEMASNALFIFYFIVLVLLLNGLLYFILCKFLKLDFHSSLISHMASIFGPPFVILIGKNLNRQDLIAPGIAVATLGVALGTFLGIFLHHVL